jgi:parallel beta-helix repeat protein
MNNKNTSALVSALGLAFLSSLYAGASSAAIKSVTTCGAVLSTAGKYQLKADLSNCPSTALTISANNVRLNLNGHTISGSNLGSGISVQSVTGVRIIGGSVSGFMNGVELNSAMNTQISGVTISNNAGYGIYLNASSKNFISGNTVSMNTSKGIYLFGGSNTNQIIGNTISNNAKGTVLDDGLQLNTSNTNKITGNMIVGNGQDGLELKDTSGNVLYGNIVNNNGRNGIFLRPSVASTTSNVVDHNTTLLNGASGIVVLGGATLNKLTQNVSVNNNQIPSTDPTVTYADMSELNNASPCLNRWLANTFDSKFDVNAVSCVK